MKKGTCIACRTTQLLTQHHIAPRTHYKDSGSVIMLCANCHLELEQRILEEEGSKKGKRNRLTKEEYFIILLNFLQEKSNEG